MSSKKGGKQGQHKPYKGPWPEEHSSSIPGRTEKGVKIQSKGHPEGGQHTPQAHKVPPPAPK